MSVPVKDLEILKWNYSLFYDIEFDILNYNQPTYEFICKETNFGSAYRCC